MRKYNRRKEKARNLRPPNAEAEDDDEEEVEEEAEEVVENGAEEDNEIKKEGDEAQPFFFLKSPFSYKT